MRKLAPGLLLLLAIACGAITIDLDTEVSETGDMTHGIALVIEGPLVALMAEEIPEGEPLFEGMPANCDASTGEESISLNCEDIPHSEFIADEELGFDVQVIQTETEDGTEYRVSMPYIFEDAESSGSEDDSSLEGLGFDPNLILELSFSWDVTVPGDIVQSKSNADSYDGSTARFETTLGDDDRKVFEVVSLVEKSSGSSGGCNSLAVVGRGLR